jgi:hypothetical protein
MSSINYLERIIMKNFEESREFEESRDNEREVLPFRSAGQRHAESGKLLSKDEIEDMRERWTEIQGTFVDSPRSAVENADKLVALAIQRLQKVFADQTSTLEKQWSKDDQATGTEELRQSLQRYRAFFERLLSI